MERQSRFSEIGVLSPDICPFPLTSFVQNLPFMDLATCVFGSEAAAAEWMCTPSLALCQRRPVDALLTDPQLVKDLLTAHKVA